MLKQAVQEVVGREVEFDQEHGATDAKAFAKRGIPAVLLLPIGENFHADDEYVEIDSIQTVLMMLKAYLEGISC